MSGRNEASGTSPPDALHSSFAIFGPGRFVGSPVFGAYCGKRFGLMPWARAHSEMDSRESRYSRRVIPARYQKRGFRASKHFTVLVLTRVYPFANVPIHAGSTGWESQMASTPQTTAATIAAKALVDEYVPAHHPDRPLFELLAAMAFCEGSIHTGKLARESLNNVQPNWGNLR